MTLTQFIFLALWTAAVFFGGLLVGRKNPKVADQAAAIEKRLLDKVNK